MNCQHPLRPLSERRRGKTSAGCHVTGYAKVSKKAKGKRQNKRGKGKRKKVKG
jgi:ribosomal protein L15E